MRQRKVKNEAERINALNHLLIKDSYEIRGRWAEQLKNIQNFNGEIYLEVGCGRGHFLASLANADPDSFFLGVEGRGSVVLRAMELINSQELTNVLFIPEFVIHMENHFDEEELSGIYLNFSDPWPKVRHAKRRLTHRDYLVGYKRALKGQGFIEFKTDSEALFDFTLDECREVGLKLEEISRDLHNSKLPSRLITTQYENRFRLMGKPIYYCRLRV